jgi:hypothetical protein
MNLNYTHLELGIWFIKAMCKSRHVKFHSTNFNYSSLHFKTLVPKTQEQVMSRQIPFHEFKLYKLKFKTLIMILTSEPYHAKIPFHEFKLHKFRIQSLNPIHNSFIVIFQ